MPGPGDYNPNQNIIKTNLGKMSVFDRSVRFEEQNKENNAKK